MDFIINRRAKRQLVDREYVMHNAKSYIVRRLKLIKDLTHAQSGIIKFLESDVSCAIEDGTSQLFVSIANMFIRDHGKNST